MYFKAFPRYYYNSTRQASIVTRAMAISTAVQSVLDIVLNTIVKVSRYNADASVQIQSASVQSDNDRAVLEQSIKDMNFRHLLAFVSLILYMVVDIAAAMFKGFDDSKRMLEMMEEVRRQAVSERWTILVFVFAIAAVVAGLQLYKNRRNDREIVIQKARSKDT